MCKATDGMKHKANCDRRQGRLRRCHQAGNHSYGVIAQTGNVDGQAGSSRVAVNFDEMD